MYEQFFNLTSDPFRLSPDHRFCYRHAQYSKAKAYMAYAFRRAEGFVVITGPPGTGKTTLIGDLLEYLAGEDSIVANLVSTQLAADDLLRSVAFAFGLEAHNVDKSSLLQQLGERFQSMLDEDGRALLVVDEAQDLTPKAMEELRLLTNLQKDEKPLLQIFLLGQPELLDMLQEKNMEPVHQRIIAASKLKALEEEETRAYVEHRLKVAGWNNDPEISPRVYSIIHLFSEGVPRRINLICNRLFLYAFVEQAHKLDITAAKAVVKELQEEQLSTGNLLNKGVFYAEEEPVQRVPAEGQTGSDVAQPAGKATFTAEEVSPTVPSSKNASKKQYVGLESRRGHRRDSPDRRDDIRFEIDKEDRRKNPGRREEDDTPDFW